MARTERESDRRRREEKWQTCWRCRDQQRACRMALASAKNFSIVGLLKRKEWPQCPRQSSWQVRQSRLCQKGKEQSRLFRVPDRKEGIQCQRSKENRSKGKKKIRVFLCRRTVRVKEKGKSFQGAFRKFKAGRLSLGRKTRERGTVSRIGR